MKRIMLFLVTNLAVMLVLGVVLNILFSVLGINKSSISGLLVFCAVFGFGGSFISLLMSKWMAKRSYGVQVIEQPRAFQVAPRGRRSGGERCLDPGGRRQPQRAGAAVELCVAVPAQRLVGQPGELAA